MTDWTGPRTPLTDPVAEAARTEAYWALLDAQPAQFEAPAHFPDADYRQGRWRRITTPAGADYEARAMRHSIGHSWDKYSQIGDVYSFRNADDVPQMTILVADGVVVHAREHRNARLSTQNRETLLIKAMDEGWDIKPDTFRFEAMFDEDPDAVNTRVVCVQRDAGNAKTFFIAVFQGRFTETDAQAVHDEYGRNSHVAPEIRLADLPHGVFGDEKPQGMVPLEIVSLRHTAEAPTTQHGISAVVRGVQNRNRNMILNDDLHAQISFLNVNVLMPFVTAHPVCGPQRPQCQKVDNRRIVVSYVIKDADTPAQAFWENSSGIGTFVNADGDQISPDTPRPGDVALFVQMTAEEGVRRFTASENADGRMIPYGMYYPAAHAQDAYAAAMDVARAPEDRRAATFSLISEANAELDNFADFANGHVFAIVHEMWEVNEDDHIARTDVQLTTACIGYNEAWDLIEDDVENDYELCGLPEM